MQDTNMPILSDNDASMLIADAIAPLICGETGVLGRAEVC
jgi:hypothetical protein